MPLMNRTLQPEGWAKPSGYSNGVSARGRTIFVAGQIGWNAESRFESDDLVDQIAQALKQHRRGARLRRRGSRAPDEPDLVFPRQARVFARLPEVGAVYREIVGRNFPAMTAVQVSG